jgi:protein-S-isoprenylcysteine O-methyltransferase Ste14
MPNGPGVRFPPPFLPAAAFLGGLALERWVYRLPIAGGDRTRGFLSVAGAALAALGLLLAGWSMLTFARARTAIVPMFPATRLVMSGPYRLSRNPMYVGLTALHVGLALLLDMAWPIILLPAALTALYALVIRREEAYLSTAFGETYRAYTGTVRRWL